LSYAQEQLREINSLRIFGTGRRNFTCGLIEAVLFLLPSGRAVMNTFTSKYKHAPAGTLALNKR
jgi:hypothetical protein